MLLYFSGCCGSSKDNLSGEMNLEHWFSSKAFPQKALVILALESDHQAVAINYGRETFGQISTRHKSCFRDLELWFRAMAEGVGALTLCLVSIISNACGIFADLAVKRSKIELRSEADEGQFTNRI